MEDAELLGEQPDGPTSPGPPDLPTEDESGPARFALEISEPGAEGPELRTVPALPPFGDEAVTQLRLPHYRPEAPPTKPFLHPATAARAPSSPRVLPLPAADEVLRTSTNLKPAPRWTRHALAFVLAALFAAGVVAWLMLSR